jgi:SSS family solute:Na+ symporter
MARRFPWRSLLKNAFRAPKATQGGGFEKSTYIIDLRFRQKQQYIMFGLTPIDLLVLAGYFIFVLAVGVWASRRIGGQEDYFLGGRRFGKFVQVFAAFGQGTSAESAVGTTVLVQRNGVAGIFSSIITSLSLPVYWITSVWYRRMRFLTLGDFFETRYRSKSMAAFYALFSAVFFMIVIALGFKAMARTVVGMTPVPVEQISVEQQAQIPLAKEWQVLEGIDASLMSDEQTERLEELRTLRPNAIFSYMDENWLIVIMALVVVAYAALGGLEAAFVSDTVQGIFTVLLSVILLPFVYFKIQNVFGVEGFSGIQEVLRAQLPASSFEVFGSAALADFTWYYLIALLIVMTLNTAVQANQMIATGSAKDEYTARFGFTTGILIKRVCTVLWGLTALCLVVLYASTVTNPDYIWGVATLDLLGPAGMGLVGLMIACMLAALMSTADALMLTASGLITHNLVRTLAPGRSEKFYVMIGKVSGAAVVAGAVLIALYFETIFGLIKLLWEFNIVVAPAFWLGLKWRRATPLAAWTSIGFATIFFIMISVLVPMSSTLRTHPELTRTIEPILYETSYTARQVNVDERAAEIAAWDALNAQGQATTERPNELEVGKAFVQSTWSARRAIYWTEGVRLNEDGKLEGKGFFSVELFLLHWLGVDLSKNVYAANETIRLTLRSFLPFLVLIVVALMTKPDHSLSVRQFYATMRTPATADKEFDHREVALSLENPERFDHRMLFQNSNWEFEKPNRVDVIGFAVFLAAGLSVLGLLYLVSLIGS